LWLLGVWHAHRGDASSLKLAQARLSRLAAGAPARATGLFGAALSALGTLVRGDSTMALEELSRLVPTGAYDTLAWQVEEPLAVERLKLAELLLARGRYAEVLETAAVFDHPGPVIYLAFLPASLSVRYRAARALDRPDLANRYRERLRRLGREAPTA
jgi:hypothetical protein